MYLGQINYNIMFYPTDDNGNIQGSESWRLALVESVEIHRSVDLLAAACVIKLPDKVYNKVEDVSDKIKRGYKVTVKLGYDAALQQEFSGYLLSINTDNNNITLTCEDSLFILRKAVKDKQFAGAGVKAIAQYILQQTGVKMTLNCTDPIVYDKFTIVSATAYDVLKKIEEETKDNIFITENAGGTRVLNIHPPYEMLGDSVVYSLQKNVEDSDLKWLNKDDLKVQIVIKSTGTDGKITEYKYGTTGGDRHTRQVSGMSGAALKQVAMNEYQKWYYDGYQGSVTGWLIPNCEPTYAAAIVDDEYPDKNGTYYVNSVTTSIGAEGGKRKIQIGRKLSNLENGQLQAIN